MSADVLQRNAAILTLQSKISDWNMSARQKRRVARRLTPLIAELFAIPNTCLDEINICFHPYPPKDFAVGRRLLADIIPRMARAAKRLLG
jgi:hypothetical protein